MEPKQAPTSFILKVVYMYMLVMHIVLPVLVFFLYKPEDGEPWSLAIGDMFPADYSSPVNLVLYLVAIATFIAGFVVPKMLGKSGAAKVVSTMAYAKVSDRDAVTQAFAPYMIRLVFFEATTLCGFVTAFLAQRPQYILPFAVLGLLGTVLSPPSEDFVKSMTGSRDP